MLTIVEGSKEQLTQEMRQLKDKKRALLKVQKQELKYIKQELKADAREGGREKEKLLLRSKVMEKERQIVDTELTTYYLVPSRVLPVEVGGFVYNYKFLEELERKLKGFVITMDIDPVGILFINYSKGNNKGHMKLMPLDEWYQHTFVLPKAHVMYPILGNETYYKGKGWAQ